MLRRALLGLALAAATSAGAAHAEGTLKMKFVFGGDPPKQSKIDPNKDAEFCGKKDLFDESLIVNPENKGIQNIVVYVYTGRGGSKIDEVKPVNKVHELANQNCRFEPHVLIMQTGDTLKVTNPDKVGHNANMSFIRNDPKNLQIPPDGHIDVAVEKPEPAPIPVDCNIHPWMRAYVVALEHPYAAKSNENGELEITGLPTGKELSFRVWAQAADGAIEEVMINGKKTKWKKNVFEVDVKDGENDLGTIEIPAGAFKKG